MLGRLPSTLAAALACAAIVAACVTAPTAPAAPAASPSGRAPSPVAATGLAPSGPTEAARVVRVVDGDTVVIDRGNGDERLRYIGIDSPESVKPDTPVEFMGHEAAVANAALVEGRTIVLERDVSDRDRFDRLLRYVWLRDDDGWSFVNLELVAQGYAQAVTFPPDVRWQDALRDAEASARARGAGLWGPPTPNP